MALLALWPGEGASQDADTVKLQLRAHFAPHFATGWDIQRRYRSFRGAPDGPRRTGCADVGVQYV